jgi:hypothetical protein
MYGRKTFKIRSNPQNLINVDAIEKFINDGIKFKKISDPDVIKWLNSTFRKHLINVIPSEDVRTIPPKSPQWMINALEMGALKRAIIGPKLLDEYHHTLDFISQKKPKLGSALELLSKVQAWDKSMSKKRMEFERKAQKYKSQSQFENMGKLEVIHKFPNGYTIMELVDDKAKDWEGNAMGHCVGGNDYESEIVYSLRDANLMPHATMQIQDKTIVQIQGKENKDIVEKYHDYIFDFIQQYDMNVEEDYLPKLGLIRIVGEIDVMPRD